MKKLLISLTSLFSLTQISFAQIETTQEINQTEQNINENLNEYDDSIEVNNEGVVGPVGVGAFAAGVAAGELGRRPIGRYGAAREFGAVGAPVARRGVAPAGAARRSVGEGRMRGGRGFGGRRR